MVNDRPKLAASEIEAVLRAALQKLPSLREHSIRQDTPVQRPEGLDMGGGQDQTGSGACAV
jgi:hypothetical protein